MTDTDDLLARADRWLFNIGTINQLRNDVQLIRDLTEALRAADDLLQKIGDQSDVGDYLDVGGLVPLTDTDRALLTTPRAEQVGDDNPSPVDDAGSSDG